VREAGMFGFSFIVFKTTGAKVKKDLEIHKNNYDFIIYDLQF
jgi:hypothetical protein